MGRIIGIRHRVKVSAEGEALPTRVVIVESGEALAYDLVHEQAELDFVTGKFPIAFRAPELEEDISGIPEWHMKLRKAKPDEEIPAKLLRVIERHRYRVSQVPDAYEGIRAGDTIAMTLGGSGDYLAFAISRQLGKSHGSVVRISPFILAKKREERKIADKNTDAELLATLAKDAPGLFYPIAERDAKLILVRERFNLRMDAMKARIACEQRLRQRLIGNVFTNPEGLYPEGGIEKAFDDLKATDTIFLALAKEENLAIKSLTSAIENLDVYQEVFAPIQGMGPMIAARIISAVIDIRRFPTAGKFGAYCGVHVLKDGRLPRLRNGQVANWHGDCRQALYLFIDQCVKRPDSTWGKYLNDTKVRMHSIHPEVVIENGKKRYTKGHIHKMAIWRTATRFAEHIYTDWTRFEEASKRVLKPEERLVA